MTSAVRTAKSRHIRNITPKASRRQLRRRSDAEWQQWQERFAALINESAALADSGPANLGRQVEATHPSHQQRADTLEALLWQLAAHNSYHTGQIAMIRRALGAWPPRGGGDTW